MDGLLDVRVSGGDRAGEQRLSAYLEAALDCVVIADLSGRVVAFNAAAERTFGYTRAEALGRTLAELIVPPSLRERHSRAFARFAETGGGTLIGRRLELTGMRADGSEFPVELALSRVEGDPVLVCGALRDISETKQAEADLRHLADEQAALRRVATLVAREAKPDEIFAAVAEESARILDVALASVLSFESDGASNLVGTSGPQEPFAVGDRYPPHPGVIAEVWRTGVPAIVNYAQVPGETAARLYAAGMLSALGVPIVVDGRTWGLVIALSTHGRPLPRDAETRLVGFTELVGTAISNTQNRDDLRRLADEQAALRRVATLVARGTRPQELFAVVAEEVARVLDVAGTSVVHYERGTAIQVGAWGRENPFRVGTRWILDEASVSGMVARTARPARVDDYTDVPGDIAAGLRGVGIRSSIGVPIVVDDEVWGVMMALSSKDRPLPAGAEARLHDFTELAATAISNTQARADLRRLVDEHTALQRVATVVAHAAPPAEVFAAVAEEVGRVLEVDVVNIVRHEDDTAATAVASWSGIGGTIPLGTRLPLDGPSIMGSVSRTGRPARIDSYADVPRAVTYVVEGVEIQAGVGVPIVVDGRVWGTVVALTTKPTPLPSDTEARLADFTELVATAISNAQARDDVRSLADEQAALRHIATLVAQGAEPHVVFHAVCEETCRLLGATSTNLAHFTPDGFNVTIAGWSVRDTHVPTGTRLPLAGGTINALVQQTVAPTRVDDYEGITSQLAGVIRQRGIRSEVGAPVLVDGRIWGALIAGTDEPDPLPAGSELRLARFSELIATAVANATTRSELVESRARIVTASDEARRRIERNLHDGTQQRLVTLGLDLQAVSAKIPGELADVRSELEGFSAAIEAVLDEVRELSRGLHPALLSQGGLRPALKTLARKSPIRVRLDLDIGRRPPESIEIAVYYVVSESLTNVAKHAQASEVSIEVATYDALLRATIEDNGIGGAQASAGSGLIGLIDRVEALGGRFNLESPPGQGTKISIELPLTERPATAPPGATRASHRTPQGVPTHQETADVDDVTTLRAAVDALAEALYIVDAQGRIEFLNPAALRILGYDDANQLVGRPSHDTIHYLRADGSPYPAAECPLLRPRVTGESVKVDEDWFVRQNGSLVRVAYSSAPISLPEGRGAVVAFRATAAETMLND
jgi:PAS domain S-box-containing protein